MAEPKFDPNKPFNEVQDEAVPQFDPNAEFEEVAEKEPEVSQAQTALDAMTQGLTFGLGDEIAGGSEALGRVLGLKGLGGPITDIGLAEEGPTLDKEKLIEAYRQGRDLQRMQQEAGEKQHPGTYLAADVTGSILTPGGLGKAGAKALTKAGLKAATKKAAATGAAAGALESAGRTEADLTSAEGLTDVGLGTLAGGALGGTIGKVASKFGKEALQEGAEAASKDANIAALKSIGAKQKDMAEELGLKTNKRASEQTAKGTGQTLLDEDVLKSRQSIGDVKDNIVDKLDEVATQRIEPLGQQADELTKQIPLRNFSDEISNFANKVDESLQNISGSTPYSKTSDKALYANMEETSQKVMEDVQMALESPNRVSGLVDIKRKLQQEVNWTDPQANAYNEYLVKMQSHVSDLINDMTSKASPELGQQMTEANKVYSNLIRANRISGDQLAKDLSSDGGIGFRDYLAAGVLSTVADNRLLGPAVIGGKKAVEKLTGKDTGKLLNTLEAFYKARKAERLGERVSDYGGLDKAVSEASEAISGASAGVAGAMADTQEANAPYKRDKMAMQYIETASPEKVVKAADTIRQDYGKDGEKLARTLEKVAEKDRNARRALLFSIMQDPNNRRMLGINEE